MAVSRHVVWEAVKQQRVSLASAITVAALLLAWFRAPATPVLVGCGLALAMMVARSYAKLRAQR